MKKRFLSCFMALALCLSLMPTAALAAEDTTEPSTQLTELHPPSPRSRRSQRPRTSRRRRRPPTRRRTLPGRGTLCGKESAPVGGDVICGCDDGGGAYALPVRR